MQKTGSQKQIVLLMCIIVCMISVIAAVSALSDGSPEVSVTTVTSPAEIGSVSGSYINANVPTLPPPLPQPPVANFAGTPPSGTAPLVVSFTDSSTNTPTGWAWFFGDETYTASWTQITASTGWSARRAHSSVVTQNGSIVLMGGEAGSGSTFKNDTWRSMDNGVTWTQVNASAMWSARAGHSCVVMPDGSIVLMGGGLENNSFSRNDVWRSIDNGVIWAPVTAHAGWSARVGHSSVVMSDGSIILMGGGDSMVGGVKNDVWRSTDNGTTWTQLTASAGWTARAGHSSVVMSDGSIILMGGGGFAGGTVKNDTWRSTDNGVTWTQLTASAGWTARAGHSSVVMPDGSIVLMGGGDGGGVKNDVWRSTDNGATWTQLTTSAGWTPRKDFTTVGLPEGSIVLMGGIGGGNKNDVWRFMPAGSSTQSPTHTYSSAGTYTVSLTARNAAGSNTKTAANYIAVSSGVVTPVANFVGTPTSGAVPLTVTFTDSSTNTPTSWSWNFGDSSSVNATVKNPVHTYASAGTYTVSLTATNSAGSNTSTRTNYITVTSGVVTPVANFAGTPTTGTAPLSVFFTDLSTNNPTGWAWFFGDENYTALWTHMTASAEWGKRALQGSVAMPDGSIVLMGGLGGGLNNDVWLSTDKGATWTQINASAGWSKRYGHSSVAMPDGSIVLLGGYDGSGSEKNDVWRSTDNGATWTQQTASAGWEGRRVQSSVAMPDGSIVLMGGLVTSGYGKNDTWRSTDNGATWTQQTASAEWSARDRHSSVVMPDGSIILMGGLGLGFSLKNDVWRSTDNGTSWTQQTASAGWSKRYGHSSVAMPDGSIVLLGGYDSSGYGKNDVWRSTDNGTTWTQLTPSAGWSARAQLSSVAMPDGGIVLMGGYNGATYYNDVWRFVPTGSSAQNPSHIYNIQGIYSVALQAYNTIGYNSTRKTGYITASGSTAPVANFTGTPATGTAPLTVTFTDSSTNTPTSWSWNFGDSSSVNATVKNPVHTYSSAGTYTVSLTATNSAGSNTSTRTSYIAVSSSVLAPVANFMGTPTSGTAPLTVQFTDSSTNNPTGWAWFFGDENYTAPWTQMTASAGWSARYGHSSVVMPDGSIVLMGGVDGGGYKNDTWRSTDNGATWTWVNASAGWSARYGHSSVVMPDGSIVLMGGVDGGGYKNDTWRSTDNGATWTRVNVSSGWTTRQGHTSIAMPDGSTVLMGGVDGGSYKNDTWRSTDNGATWTRVNASAGWSARNDHSSVVMPDGSIVLMGGDAGSRPYKNDVWRSTDKGATWTRVNASAGWSARSGHTSVAIPDGSIVLMGGIGSSYYNDVWRFVPTGSSAQNPSHTYTSNGTYTVALTATNSAGSNTLTRTNFISVGSGAGTPVANFTGTPTSGTAPLIVTFTDRSTNTPTSWSWDFGDGSSVNSTMQNPVRTYSSVGTYTVSLTATNSAGSNTTTRTSYITVSSESPAKTSPADDLALHADTSASDDGWGGGSSKSDLTDGWRTYDDEWARGLAFSYGEWHQVTVDFGHQVTFNRVIQWYHDGMNNNEAAAYTLQYWNGSNWVDIFETDNSHAYLKYPDASSSDWWYSWSTPYENTFAPVVTDKLRIWNYPISGSHTWLYEVEVYLANPPVATFTGTPTSGTAPLTVTFTESSTNTPTSWSWDFGDGSSVNSTMQNPVHTYANNGIYTVSLTATNSAGSNTFTRTNYITVSAVSGVDNVGVFRDGVFYRNGADAVVYGIATDTPVIGDWNGDGMSEVGVYRDGVFYRKDASDIVYGIATDTPVIGDWNGDGMSEVGVYRDGVFYRKDATDIVYGLSTDIPVIGDWNGDGMSEVGVYRDGVFYRKDAIDIVYGLSTDTPVIGKWT